MNDINLAVVSGTVDGEPRPIELGDGKRLLSFRLRVASQWEGKESCTWLSVTCWDRVARELAGLRNGNAVLVEGRLKVRKYQTTDGTPKTVTEINARNVSLMGSTAQPTQAPSNGGSDDLPF